MPINLPGDPYVYSTGITAVNIRRRVNGVLQALNTIITGTISDGVCAAIDDYVSFTHPNGLVTKSRITDHGKMQTGLLANGPIVVPSDRHVISGSNTNAQQSYVFIAISDDTGVEVGMEVTGDNLYPGTFVTSMASSGNGLGRYCFLNQPKPIKENL